MAAKRRRDLVRVALGVLLAGAIVLGGFSAYDSQLLAVKRVEVDGASHLTEERVLDLAAVPGDATLLRLPASAIRDRLLEEPWIAEAGVKRRLPDTVRLVVTEREPAALLDTGGASLWLIDSEGFVLGERSPEETATLTVVRDVPGLEPEAGSRLRSDALANALRVLDGLSPELASQVRAIAAPAVEETALYTFDDVEVFVGSADELSKKDMVARRILEEQKGKVVYVNVRTVDRPTWRGLDTEE